MDETKNPTKQNLATVFGVHLQEIESFRRYRFDLTIRFIILISQVAFAGVIAAEFSPSGFISVVGITLSLLICWSWHLMLSSARRHYACQLSVSRTIGKELGISPIGLEADWLNGRDLIQEAHETDEQHKFRVRQVISRRSQNFTLIEIALPITLFIVLVAVFAEVGFQFSDILLAQSN